MVSKISKNKINNFIAFVDIQKLFKQHHYCFHISPKKTPTLDLKRKNEVLEDSKNTVPASPVEMEAPPSSSSSSLESELIITTTCAGSANEKQFPLTSVPAECCESDQTSSDQDCSFMVHDNLGEHLSSHFEHGSTVSHDEELDMTFSRSVYGEIRDKDIGPFHSEGRCTLCNGQ